MFQPFPHGRRDLSKGSIRLKHDQAASDMEIKRTKAVPFSEKSRIRRTSTDIDVDHNALCQQ
ncbi:hypothetical protein D3C81_2205220 [compost metagenome]